MFLSKIQFKISLFFLSSLFSLQSFAKSWDAYITVYFDLSLAISERTLFKVQKSEIRQATGQKKGNSVYGEITDTKISYENNDTIHITVNGDFVGTDYAANHDFLNRLMRDFTNSSRLAFERSNSSVIDGKCTIAGCSASDKKHIDGNIAPDKLDFVFPIQIIPTEDSDDPINVFLAKGYGKGGDKNQISNDWYFGLDTNNSTDAVHEVVLKDGHNNSHMYFHYTPLSKDGKTRKNLMLILKSTTSNNKFDLYISESIQPLPIDQY